MDNITDELTDIERRHKKEKKELQAHIQSLKKTAKNDKTKKKELTAEITKLEIEMDLRHKQEIADIQPVMHEVPEETSIETIETEVAKVKISKAQKRRDKKSQQEKEREEQIKQQEVENLHGPRHTEMQAISTKLKELGLKIFQIPSDGDCLYKAVSHQMAVIRGTEVSVGDLRKCVSQYIRENKDDFIPFMCNHDTGDMLTSEEFEDYCGKIESTKVWGGQLEIRALSNCLKCPINVIQASGPTSIEQGSDFEGPSLILTYHRHMYKLGEHYNSTILHETEEENSQ